MRGKRSVVVQLERRGQGQRRRRREPFAGRHGRAHLTHLPAERRLTSFGPPGIRKRQPADRKARGRGLCCQRRQWFFDRENACRVVVPPPICSFLLSRRSIACLTARVLLPPVSSLACPRQLGKEKAAARRCVIVVVVGSYRKRCGGGGCGRLDE
ncbi:hypothetical protein MTO96_000995 [Rhipicephalus appendiculatus]